LFKLYKILEKYKVRIVYIPLVLYWVLLLVATSIPSKSLPKVAIGDKFEHFLAYFILAILVLLAFHFQRKFPSLYSYPILSTIAIVSVYGLFDELHQILIPGRYAELYDWLANFIGTIFGVVLVYFLFLKPNKNYLENRG